MDKKAIEILWAIKFALWCAVALLLCYGIARSVLSMCHHTETTIVVDCVPTYEYYEVVVEDAHGEQWAYFDDEYMEIGTEINVAWDGDSITEAERR